MPSPRAGGEGQGEGGRAGHGNDPHPSPLPDQGEGAWKPAWPCPGPDMPAIASASMVRWGPDEARREAQARKGEAMTFEEVLDQAMAMLQRRGRLTYRTLKLHFQLDDEHLEALTDELIYSQRLALDEDGRVLVWTGSADVPQATLGVGRRPRQPYRRRTTPSVASSRCCSVIW
jgi:hypothetical protein